MPESEPHRSSRDSSININPLDSSTQVHPAKAVIRNCFVPTLLMLVITIVSIATYQAEEASPQLVIAPLDHVTPGEVTAADRAEAGNTRVEGAETGGAIVAIDTGSAPSNSSSGNAARPCTGNCGRWGQSPRWRDGSRRIAAAGGATAECSSTPC